MSGLLDLVRQASGPLGGQQNPDPARAMVLNTAYWLDGNSPCVRCAQMLRAEVDPPFPPTVQIVLDWMDCKTTGSSQGDAEALVDLLRDAKMLREDTP